MPKPKPAAEQPTFEQALTRLEEIAQSLEDGNLGLDDSLAHYEEGVKHLKMCHKLLEKAERRIELLSGVDAEGNPIAKPFDDDEIADEEKPAARSTRRGAKKKKKVADASKSESLDEPPGLF